MVASYSCSQLLFIFAYTIHMYNGIYVDDI
jgi:hypothetical protein